MASLYTVGATLNANPTRFVRGFQRASASVELLHKQLNRVNGAMMAQNSAFARSALANPAMAKNLGRSAEQVSHVNRAMRDGVRSSEALARSSGNVSRHMNTAANTANLYKQDLDRFNRTARGVSMTAMGFAVASVAAVKKSLSSYGSYESALAGVNSLPSL